MALDVLRTVGSVSALFVVALAASVVAERRLEAWMRHRQRWQRTAIHVGVPLCCVALTAIAMWHVMNIALGSVTAIDEPEDRSLIASWQWWLMLLGPRDVPLETRFTVDGGRRDHEHRG